jgi:mannose-6-phosphate isomerase-like protein (cupin superfamily)
MAPETEADTVQERQWTSQQMEARIVRYGALRPCYNAFIDTRTPGSETKENFTIIGPGVSENPAQYVHIAEPHGFNIGGARQPPDCINSQHSHETAEVFVVHSGRWRFDFGVTGEDARVELAPGDVISLPVHTFRGFTALAAADDGSPGFLWAVLGQDDPGRVTWAPQVFEMARKYGLVLLESGRLIDTTAGETVPGDEKPMPPTSAQDATRFRRVSADEAQRYVVAAPAVGAPGRELLIGMGGALAPVPGFSLLRQVWGPAECSDNETIASAQVVFVHRGSLVLEWRGGEVTVNTGDTITVPVGLSCRWYSVDGATSFTVRAERSGEQIAAQCRDALETCRVPQSCRTNTQKSVVGS